MNRRPGEYDLSNLSHSRSAPSSGWSGLWRSYSTPPWSSPNWRGFTRKTSPVVNMSRQSSVRCQQRMSKMDKICFSTVEYILSHEHLFRWKFSLYNSFDSRDQKGKTTWGRHPSEFSYIFRRVRGFCQFGTAGRAYHFSSSHLCLLSKQPLRRVF